ncbi:MAG TPA: imidazoleglycerol-phosphate dehydratase HisB [Bacillota bacterium]|nr:imidazoleglycerol-phosphate dehydratase HisB [Bacillota bacterium]HOK69221.1 imidazoleglycerol-phosphate dehydratase HisB [Bacillota bacterium]HPP84674.1 imidazoleglycerol-phosphate dehydratase HisB [Bacillota bacterium]
MREAQITRNTKETQITLTLNLDGSGTYSIDTGCGFLDHMLELFAAHGSFDLTVTCKGDTKVDYHHTVEDVAIVLGKAFDQALGDRAGITRYGSMILPMDEALILAAVDISGRAALGYALEIPAQKVGDFDTELVKEFMTAFSRALGAAVHVKQFAGENSHHIIEGAFKALARALKAAVAIDQRMNGRIPSTKGLIL